MRTYGLNQAMQFGEGIWLHQMISQNEFLNKDPFLRNMFWAAILYKNHVLDYSFDL